MHIYLFNSITKLKIEFIVCDYLDVIKDCSKFVIVVI
jgi:hypothetical protein